MLGMNLQTSFLTPPFGFSLFYLRGVAPKSIPTSTIYRGVLPFIVIQLIGLAIVVAFPEIVTGMLD
jgi:TRAP-type mannitol/chloroaromatic compound transport system permease large subunit